MGTSTSRPCRLAAACGVLALGAVLAVPATAWGSTDAGEPSEEDGTTQDGQPGGGERGGGEPGEDQPGEGQRDEARTDEEDVCEPLVTHAPEWSTGDRHAVAITSQALERGVPGWLRVGWEAAEGTTIDEVHVVREEETERLRDGDLQTGGAEHVLELRFCGSVTPARDEHDEGAPEGPEETGDPDEPDDGTPRSDEGSRGTPDAPSDPAPAEGEDQADDEAGDVEVLGVQLTAESADADVPGRTLPRTGLELPVLATLGSASAALGLMVLATGRRLGRRTG